MTTKNIFFNLGRLVALCGAIMDAEDHWRVLNFQAEPEKEKTIQYLLTKYSLNVVDCEEEKPEKCGGQMKNKKREWPGWVFLAVAFGYLFSRPYWNI